MKKVRYYPYILLALFSFLLFFIPESITEKIRSQAAAFSQTFWKAGVKGQRLTLSLAPTQKAEKSRETLEAENLLLKTQNSDLQHLVSTYLAWIDEVEKIKELKALMEKTGLAFYQRRLEASKRLLESKLFSVPAQVIYRNYKDWNSTCWVNVGTTQNALFEKEIIAVGSPVLKGPHLIGMIEYVGSDKSRIRLLTDGALIPSVRVARGGEENRELKTCVQELLLRLAFKEADKEAFVGLKTLLSSLNEKGAEQFLAKGELIGSGGALWKKRSEVLKGVGFNYDFEDEEGPPLEIESGRPLDQLQSQPSIPLIKVGDLLVTTGMDGIFPKDLPVAYVIKVDPLKEGSPSFDIQARLGAGNLEDLFDVIILPPLVKKSPCDGLFFNTKGDN